MKKQNKNKKQNAIAPKRDLCSCLVYVLFADSQKKCFALLLKKKLMGMVATKGDLQQHYPHNLN